MLTGDWQLTITKDRIINGCSHSSSLAGVILEIRLWASTLTAIGWQPASQLNCASNGMNLTSSYFLNCQVWRQKKSPLVKCVLLEKLYSTAEVISEPGSKCNYFCCFFFFLSQGVCGFWVFQGQPFQQPANSQQTANFSSSITTQFWTRGYCLRLTDTLTLEFFSGRMVST